MAKFNPKKPTQYLTTESNQAQRMASKADAHASAVAWLKWACERDGVEFPQGSVNVTFNDCVATVNELRRVNWHVFGSKDETGEELLRKAIPAWAMPTPRADLFHIAMQSGKTPADSLKFGMGWYGRNRADEAAMPAEEWDTQRAHESMRVLQRDKLYRAGDIEEAIGTEAGKADFDAEMALFGSYGGRYREAA